jgi:hypothetical protein
MQRIIDQLIPLTSECDMTSKHTAMLLSKKKPITYGFNHHRSCNNNQMILSFHAEMHVLSKYFSMNNEHSLRNFMNDSDFTLMNRGKQSYLLSESEEFGEV